MPNNQWLPFAEAKSLCVDGAWYLTWRADFGYRVDRYLVKGTHQGFDWPGYYLSEDYCEPTHFMFLPEPPQ